MFVYMPIHLQVINLLSQDRLYKGGSMAYNHDIVAILQAGKASQQLMLHDLASLRSHDTRKVKFAEEGRGKRSK